MKRNETPITPIALIGEGFIAHLYQGHIIYKKGKFGVVCDLNVWLPLNLDFGEPRCTNQYVTTMEELLTLANETQCINREIND